MKIPKIARLYIAAAILGALPSAARAAPLTVVGVDAPAINCVYNKACKIVVTDSVDAVPLRGIIGSARLQTRSFVGENGTLAAGMYGYLYRIDLTQAVGNNSSPCVATLKLDFGPLVKLPYVAGAPPSDVFVITTGGVGNIGLSSADMTGNVITFTFSKPVCYGLSAARGDTSYFIGLTAAAAPKAATAQMQLTGGAVVNVPARVPAH